LLNIDTGFRKFWWISWISWISTFSRTNILHIRCKKKLNRSIFSFLSYLVNVNTAFPASVHFKTITYTMLAVDGGGKTGVQTVGRKTGWANYFLGDRRLGDNSHFRKDVSSKDGWATKA